MNQNNRYKVSAVGTFLGLGALIGLTTLDKVLAPNQLLALGAAVGFLTGIFWFGIVVFDPKSKYALVEKRAEAARR